LQRFSPCHLSVNTNNFWICRFLWKARGKYRTGFVPNCAALAEEVDDLDNKPSDKCGRANKQQNVTHDYPHTGGSQGVFLAQPSKWKAASVLDSGQVGDLYYAAETAVSPLRRQPEQWHDRPTFHSLQNCLAGLFAHFRDYELQGCVIFLSRLCGSAGVILRTVTTMASSPYVWMGHTKASRADSCYRKNSFYLLSATKPFAADHGPIPTRTGPAA
jgi:hypothetical protein